MIGTDATHYEMEKGIMIILLIDLGASNRCSGSHAAVQRVERVPFFLLARAVNTRSSTCIRHPSTDVEKLCRRVITRETIISTSGRGIPLCPEKWGSFYNNMNNITVLEFSDTVIQ